MLTTSGAYKKAIKEPIREFKSQIEFFAKDSNYVYPNEYTLSSSNLTISGDEAEISNTITMLDNKGYTYKYASLEQDYTQLDGSFILPNRDYDNKLTGYIGNINSSTFTLETTGRVVLGEYIGITDKITINFGEEYATDFDITIIPIKERNSGGTVYFLDEKTKHYTNNSNFITIDLPEVDESEIGVGYKYVGCKKIMIKINNWSNDNRRVKIEKIYKGNVILFKDNEIVDIKLLEQTDIYNENLPSNDLNFTLNNYDKKFNLLDMNNLYNSMDENTYIVPTIGLNTENGYEYLTLGRYSFKNYENDKNMLVKINCIGAVEKLLDTDRQYITSTSQTIDSSTSWGASFLKIARISGSVNKTIDLQKSNYNSYKEQVQAVGLIINRFIKQEKDLEKCFDGLVGDNSLTYEMINTNNIIDIKEEQELSYPEIKKRDRIKYIKANYIKDLGLNMEGSNYKYTTIFDDYVYNTYYNPEQNRWENQIDIKSSTPHTTSTGYMKFYFNNVLTTITFGLSYNEYELSFTNASPDEGEQVKIELVEYNNSNQFTIIQNNNIDNGETIEYNCNFLNNNSDIQAVANNIFALDKEYEFTLEILGDLSLEVGDIIYFETPYYENMYGIIQSIDTTYNGGLTQIIKGVCSNVL